MSFSVVGETVTFPRDEYVDIRVREITLDDSVQCVDIREWIKSGEVYGHGLVLPFKSIRDLKIALDRVSE